MTARFTAVRKYNLSICKSQSNQFKYSYVYTLHSNLQVAVGQKVQTPNDQVQTFLKVVVLLQLGEKHQKKI
jgi:hypothetical protein